MVSWSSATGSGVTTSRRSVRPRLRSRSPTTGQRCRSSSEIEASNSHRLVLGISPTLCDTCTTSSPETGRPNCRDARSRSVVRSGLCAPKANTVEVAHHGHSVLIDEGDPRVGDSTVWLRLRLTLGQPFLVES